MILPNSRTCWNDNLIFCLCKFCVFSLFFIYIFLSRFYLFILLRLIKCAVMDIFVLIDFCWLLSFLYSLRVKTIWWVFRYVLLLEQVVVVVFKMNKMSSKSYLCAFWLFLPIEFAFVYKVLLVYWRTCGLYQTKLLILQEKGLEIC